MSFAPVVLILLLASVSAFRCRDTLSFSHYPWRSDEGDNSVDGLVLSSFCFEFWWARFGFDQEERKSMIPVPGREAPPGSHRMDLRESE